MSEKPELIEPGGRVHVQVADALAAVKGDLDAADGCRKSIKKTLKALREFRQAEKEQGAASGSGGVRNRGERSRPSHSPAGLALAHRVLHRGLSPGRIRELMNNALASTEATPLRQLLKRGTAASHRRLEAQLRLLEPDLDARRYRRALELLYGFYSPVERGLNGFVATVPLPFPLRARAAKLEDDLTTLGLSRAEIARLPPCADTPGLSCSEEFAGCLYVLEGACLGGQVVAPVLRRRLGVANGTGASFFAGDEERTLARWAAVLAWLEGLARTGTPQGPIVAAASATFEALARWVEQQEPSWASRASHGRSERLRP